MDVHIVCADYKTTKSLARKARLLVEHLGWTMSNVPRKNADIQYAFPYLSYKEKCDTPFAAYFTHKEISRPGKAAMWDDRARRAKLRVVSAKQYCPDLSRHGQTVQILPPIDNEKFCIVEGPQNPKPVIGVAGWVYRGGRKGEHLVEKVVDSRFRWVACGGGWPIPTTYYEFDELEQFYQSLDVFVCTSLVEGTPNPPLEALACGKKIVIPKGVGLLDELPNVKGIFRYEAGNAFELKEKINEAVETVADPYELRKVTDVFNVDGWVRSHKEIFSDIPLNCNVEPVKKQKDKGIYIVAYGEKAQQCSEFLINSINQFMPDIQVMVVGDRKPEGVDFFKQLPDLDIGARLAKLSIYDTIPRGWKYVIYLDADTLLKEPIYFMFEALKQGWEMVFTKNPGTGMIKDFLKRKSGMEEYQYTVSHVGTENAMILNGGVWGFRKCASVKRFFNEWKDEFCKFKMERDQPGLIRAFNNVKLKALLLGNEWNSFTRYKHENSYEIVRHYSGTHARRKGSYKHKSHEFSVVNSSKYTVERAGKVFKPGTTFVKGLTPAQCREIKACNGLEVISYELQTGGL